MTIVDVVHKELVQLRNRGHEPDVLRLSAKAYQALLAEGEEAGLFKSPIPITPRLFGVPIVEDENNPGWEATFLVPIPLIAPHTIKLPPEEGP